MEFPEDKEKAVLDFIKLYKQENQGTSPSLEEIADGCGLAGRAHSKYYIEKLEEKKMIVFAGTRNIRITEVV